MQYVGIDPGVTGSICILNGTQINIYGFEFNNFDWEENIGEDHKCWIEKVWSSPNQSVSNAFKFGENFGYWKGVMCSAGMCYQELTPYEWQSHFKLDFTGSTYSDKKRQLHTLCIKELEKNNFSVKVTQKNSDSVLIALALKKHTEDVTNRNQLSKQYLSGR